MSSLRSSAIPLTAAHVSNVCRGMSDGSFGGGGEGGGGRVRDAKDATWSASKEELPGTSFL